jgi:hypothetical protein
MALSGRDWTAMSEIRTATVVWTERGRACQLIRAAQRVGQPSVGVFPGDRQLGRHAGAITFRLACEPSWSAGTTARCACNRFADQ